MMYGAGEMKSQTVVDILLAENLSYETLSDNIVIDFWM